MSDLEIEGGLRIPLKEFSFTYARSSGPGGQNVNKVNTKVQLRWPVTTSASLPEAVRQRFLAAFGTRVTNDGDLVLSSTRYRDQASNQEDCLEKLREMLKSVARPPKKRRKTKPTRGSVERRLSAKKRKGDKKEGRRKPPD